MAKLLCLVAAMLMASVCGTALCIDCAMGDAGRCGSIAGHIGAGCASLLEAGDGGDSGGFATTESRLESCQHACGVWAGTCGACLCACHLGLRCRLCRLCSRCPLLPHGGPAPALTKSADGGVRVVAHEWTVLCTYCGSRMCAYGLCSCCRRRLRPARLRMFPSCRTTSSPTSASISSWYLPSSTRNIRVSQMLYGMHGLTCVCGQPGRQWPARNQVGGVHRGVQVCVCACARVCACACVLLCNSGQITDVS